MRFRRFFGATVGAMVVSIGLSGVAGASTGINGNHLFRDSQEDPGAVCRYERVSDTKAKIIKINVRAPKVWWPDRDADNDTEHGKVAWRAVIEHTNAGPGFVFLKRTGWQYATAYEGGITGYDPTKKAPFTNMAVGITARDLPAGDELRAIVKVRWIKKDGTTLGTDNHVVQWYLIKTSKSDTGFEVQNPCAKNLFYQ